MSLTIQGKIKNSSGERKISLATVRLYRKDTGAFIDDTTSDTLGEFTFTGLTDFSPYELFALAYTDNFKAAIGDVRKSYIYDEHHIYGDVIDTDTDILVVEPPYTGCRLIKVSIESSILSSGIGSIDIRNASSGGGSGITVSITNGLYRWSNTGDLTTVDYFYVRSVDPLANLSDVSIVFLYEHPMLIMFPLGGS